MRVSWSLIPGILAAPWGMGSARRWKHGEINVHVEGLRLKCGEAVGDGSQHATHVVEIIESLVKPEILEIVAERFPTQEGGEFLVHPHHRVLGVSAQYMMAMFGALQHTGQLATDALMQASAEDLGDAVGAEPQQAQIA
jgi:hypothetical protein